MTSVTAAFEIGELVVAAAGTAAEISSQQKGQEAQEAVIKRRQLQIKVAATQRAQKRARRFQAVVSSQEAIGAAHGISLSSPSFAAIKLQSFSQFQKDNQNADLNEEFEQNSLNTEIDASSAKASAAEWGAGLNFLGGAFQQVNLNQFGGEPKFSGQQKKQIENDPFDSGGGLGGF